jgi:hypothetical protein
VGPRPVLSSRTRNGFDLAVNQRNDFPTGHVVVGALGGTFARAKDDTLRIRSSPGGCAYCASYREVACRLLYGRSIALVHAEEYASGTNK